MFDLKVDNKLPYHYIIGGATDTTKSSTSGKMFLKYGSIHFKNKDIEHISNSLKLMEDKIYTEIYKMNSTDTYKMMECSEIVMSLIGINLVAQTNYVTLHHFSYEFEFANAYGFL